MDMKGAGSVAESAGKIVGVVWKEHVFFEWIDDEY